MPDDTRKKGAQDRSRINIHEPYEVEYWTKTLKVSKQKLKEAVEAVGTSVTKVRDYLGEKRKSA